MAMQVFQRHCVRAQVRWMWADVGVNATFAKKNPARWSNQQSIDETSSELWCYLSTENVRRPVRLEFCAVTHDGIGTKLVTTEANISEALQMLGAFEVQLVGDIVEDHKIAQEMQDAAAHLVEAVVPSCPPPVDANEEADMKRDMTSSQSIAAAVALVASTGSVLQVDEVEESLSKEPEETPQAVVVSAEAEESAEAHSSPTSVRALSRQSCGDATPKRKSLSLSEALAEKVDERHRRKSSPMLVGEDLERRIEELAMLSRTTKELHDQNLKRRRKTVPTFTYM
jgi:hypothetical protein